MEFVDYEKSLVGDLNKSLETVEDSFSDHL